MSDCNCILNKTILNENIIYNDDNINIDKFLNFIPQYNSDISGIWRPLFIPSETVSGIVNINFKNNIKLRDWSVTLDNGSIDYGVNFSIDCNRENYFSFKDPDLYVHIDKSEDRIKTFENIYGLVFFKETVNISGFLLPVTVRISGIVDDALVINDETKVECKENQIPPYYKPEDCEKFYIHETIHNFKYNEESFTVATQDTCDFCYPIGRYNEAWYDLKIGFEPEYESLLCWYRYYDIGRNNDNRIQPGLDIYISDGDCVRVNEDYYYINTVISGIAHRIKTSLDTTNLEKTKYKANLLASGPQFDWVSENLTYDDNGINYKRDEYGLIIPFLSGMSDKIYSDIGKNNYISSKTQLFNKLRDKYPHPSGFNIVVKENSSIKFDSKFKTKNGSNFSIDLNHKLTIKDSGNASGYDFYILSGDLKLEAKQSKETIVRTARDPDYGETLESEPYNVNYIKFNDKTIGYTLTNSVSGVFDPGINGIKFHGLGGVDFNSIGYGSSCSDSFSFVGEENERKVYINNSTNYSGPWFLDSYKNAPSEGIINNASGITIYYKVYDNSELLLNDNLFTLNYLRTDDKTNCTPFISNSCQCYPLVRLSPEAKKQNSLTNKNDNLYTPATSSYHMPSGYFYGGLSEQRVKSIGVFPPYHPKAGTKLPKNHKPYNFPNSSSCNYSYYNQNFDEGFPYTSRGVGEKEFSITFGEISAITLDCMISDGSGIFKVNDKEKILVIASGNRDKLCYELSPKNALNDITIYASGTHMWHWRAIPTSGSASSIENNTISMPVKKGFFHPNSGWINNNFGKTSIVPYSFNSLFSISPKASVYNLLISYDYNIEKMYNAQYLTGYNYLCSGSVDAIQQISKSKYLGVKLNDSSSTYINTKYDLIQYDEKESLVLEQMPFEYVNMDLTYGYAYNDFKYVNDGNTITIYSDSDINRISSYLDDTEYGEYDLVLYPVSSLNDPITVTVVSCSGNKVIIDGSLEENKRTGYVSLKRRPSDYSQSVIVYQPYSTEMDDIIGVGKWGNMTYGGFLKNVSENFVNNNKLRTSITNNTYKSWGTPLVFDNNYNNDKSYYFPTTRLFDDYVNDERAIHILGYNNQYDSSIAKQSGDLIVSNFQDVYLNYFQSWVNNRSAYIYVGSYIGPYKLFCMLRSLQSQDQYFNIRDFLTGKVRLSHGGNVLAEIDMEDYRWSSDYINNNKPYFFWFQTYLSLEFEKTNALPVYAKLEYIPNESCFPDKLYIPSYGTYMTNKFAKIVDYKVQINEDLETLRNQSRIAYYAHQKSIRQDKIVSLSGLNEDIVTPVQDIVNPLLFNNDYLVQKAKDYSPYLDLHIFTDDEEYAPIKSVSGYVYFENFMKPVNPKNMKIPYNSGLCWVNISPERDSQWSFVTSSGFWIKPDIRYGILKKLKFNCSGQSSSCSERYSYDVCENEIYNLTNSQVFERMGISSFDQQFLEIHERSFPDYCDSINYCCEDVNVNTKYADTNYVSDCNNAQKDTRKNCKDYWKNKKWDISCLDSTCPTGNITGQIGLSADYLVFNLKQNIDIGSYLKQSNDNNLTFFRNDLNIPNSSVNFFKAVLEVSKPSGSCETQCSRIIPDLSYDVGQDYLSLSFGWDYNYLTPSCYNSGSIKNSYPLWDSLIFKNELKYRENFDHPNKISLPFSEYDRNSESNFLISHNFSVSSTGCVDAGTDLCDITVDGLSCYFKLTKESDNNLYITSSCFKKFLVGGNVEENTVDTPTYYKDDSFPCGNACGAMSENEAVETLKNNVKQQWSEDNYTITFEEIENSETIVCEVCCGACETELEYIGAVERECHCPDFAQLIDTPEELIGSYGLKCCSYSANTEFSVGALGSENCGQLNYKTVTKYFPASCFDEHIEPLQEQLDAYESCDSTEITLSKTIQEVLAITNSPNLKDYNELKTKRMESYAEHYTKICQFNNEYNQCINNCGNWFDQMCTCQCNANFGNSVNNELKNYTVYYNCYNNCSESDSLYYNCFNNYYINCSEDDEGCGNIPYCVDLGTSSWADCDYKPCQNLEDRVKGKPTIEVYTDCGCYQTHVDQHIIPGCEGFPDYIFGPFDGIIGPNFSLQGIICTTSNEGAPDESPPNPPCNFPECFGNGEGFICEVITPCGTPTKVEIKHELYKQIDSEVKFITRDVTYNYKRKVSTVSKQKYEKAYSKKYKVRIQLKTDLSCGECDENSKCCSTYRYDGIHYTPSCIPSGDVCCSIDQIRDINFNVKFDIYKDLTVAYLNDNKNDRICWDRGEIISFKCPKITYNKSDRVIICDSVSSLCTDCKTGKIEELN